MARILIVDDDPDLAESCQVILENAGHQLRWAASVKAGLEAIQKESPDLLILDVMMDEVDDGIQMARKLKKEACPFPILMFTSISKVMGMDYGKDDEMIPVDEFLEKPVRPEVMIAKVDALLKSHGGQE